MNRKKIMGKLLALSLTAATAMSSAAIPAFAGTASNSAVSTYAADETDDSYTYVYAGLTWNEYWASEGVYAAGNTDSNPVLDSHNETDKGGFDVVTRATTNHGLHRGSYQCIAYVEDTNGEKHYISHWNTSDDKTSKGDAVMTDGKVYTAKVNDDSKLEFTCSADNTSFVMEDYKVIGTKYVPVAVKTADLEAFKAKYTVVENGGTLAGGYSEGKLSSYSETANVTANTNGLKVATKNEDGTFSFSARKTGSDSGIADKTLKTATNVEPEVKEASGSYGEFLRVDINGDYGDLGANMQAIQWTYYGSDSTYSKPLATYGTKFAADNWMHKSMGMQLGLTDSIRCQLPKGTDGTGYWRLTVYALGYEDYTYDFQATDANIVKDNVEDVDTSNLEAAITKADALNEADYTADSWASLKAELDESKELLDNAKSGKATQAEVTEQTAHLNDAIAHLVLNDTFTYVYAGLTWNEYWLNEGVYAAGNTDSNPVLDSHNETDKGGFDVVTRATTNHGLHRGSYQCIAYVEDTNGEKHYISHWNTNTDKTTKGDAVMTDGKVYTAKVNDNSKLEFTCSADNTSFVMADYKVIGTKYVPVAVKTADLEAFKAKYTVVENGGTLVGGYSEGKLSSYSEIANVTANTNGLKVATKNENGTFSFSARKTGSDSGIADKTLKKATNVEPEVKEASGSYGEFLRVDINGDYGDLGANMQAIQWTYYGSDSTYSKPLATYGTKFAADNWMHKSMGMQLGLTDSIRCQLPQDTDGTGYWRLTVYALGYEDYTYDFQATDANIVKDTEEEINTSDLEAAIAKADALNETDYTADSWASFKAELDESKELLDNAKAGKATQAEITEQTAHLNDAISHLVALKHITAVSLNKVSATLITGKTLTLKATVTPADTTDNTTVTYKSSNSAVASVDAKGNVTAKSAGTATITATAGNKSATCKVTVVNKAGKATLSKTAFTYNKKVQKPSVTVKDSKGNKISSANYTVKYANSKNPGRYAVTVSFQGVYAGTASQTLYYDIKPAATSVKLSKATKNSITAKWGASAGVTGYEIQYSTSSSFKKAVKTVKVSSKTTSKKLTKLTKNKKYFVRVRAYKSVTVNKKKVTLNASWSAVKNLKTKKK